MKRIIQYKYSKIIKNTASHPFIFSNIQSFFILTFSLFLLLTLLLHPSSAYAAPEDQKVYDNYGLFTEDEANQLEEIAKENGEKGKVDIVIITEASIGDKTRKKYLEDFYDQYGFGYNKEFGDAALILINMDPSDRGVEIQGYGEAEYYLNNDRIEYVLDDIVPLLSDGRYYDAMVQFAEETAYYMNEKKGVNTSNPVGGENSGEYYGESSYDGPSNYYGEKQSNILFNPLVQLGISLVIGAIVVGSMAYGSGGRMTVNNNTYIDNQHSMVVARRDDYIRTVTTRVRKPSNNGGGGRSSGGGGISSGGSSHSGGGRGF